MNFETYAQKWNRDPNNNFAVACYNDNSVSELQAPHAPQDADKTDCMEWGISPGEWADGIEAALSEKLND